MDFLPDNFLVGFSIVKERSTSMLFMHNGQAYLIWNLRFVSEGLDFYSGIRPSP